MKRKLYPQKLVQIPYVVKKEQTNIKDGKMMDVAEPLWTSSIISLILHFLQVIRRVIDMALCSNSPSPSLPSLKWKGFRLPGFPPKGVVVAPVNYSKDKANKENDPTSTIDSSCTTFQVPYSEGLALASKVQLEKNRRTEAKDFGSEGVVIQTETKNLCSGGCPEENLRFGQQNFVFNPANFTSDECPQNNSNFSRQEELNSLAKGKMEEVKSSQKLRKRPTMIVIPELRRGSSFREACFDVGEQEFQVEGKDFYLASKRGRRMVMEDSYGVITDVSGDSKQAFFGVFDGYGGRAAVDHVTEKLGKNIVKALGEFDQGDQMEKAIRAGYLTTDKEFLTQGLRSGACAATVLLKDGMLHVANVGDCRVVLSRKGVANALTIDHRVEREEERFRIENSGGYVNCQNGIWRAQGSLAVSRAIGDFHLKEWIISEPETNIIQLTSDCEFLIMASDGLWDKVSNQEAVDVVLRYKNPIESCKKLVDISCSRGNKDDITVMVVELQNFLHN